MSSSGQRILLLNVSTNFLNFASYNIVFLLSGGGTLNYFGAKSFIDQELEGILNVHRCNTVKNIFLYASCCCLDQLYK